MRYVSKINCKKELVDQLVNDWEEDLITDEFLDEKNPHQFNTCFFKMCNFVIFLFLFGVFQKNENVAATQGAN